eukprot:g12121.t1
MKRAAGELQPNAAVGDMWGISPPKGGLHAAAADFTDRGESDSDDSDEGSALNAQGDLFGDSSNEQNDFGARTQGPFPPQQDVSASSSSAAQPAQPAGAKRRKKKDFDEMAKACPGKPAEEQYVPPELKEPVFDETKEWDMGTILKDSVHVKTHDLRTIPISAQGDSGYTTVFACWSEKKTSGWTRKKVATIFLEAVKKAKHWNPNDFSLFVARERKRTSVVERIARAKKGISRDDDEEWGWHVIIDFAARTQALHKLEASFKAMKHNVALEIVAPGRGGNPLVTPCEYLMKYNPEKEVDDEPMSLLGFQVPAKALELVKKQAERMKNKPLSELEVHAFLVERPKLLRKRGKAAMQSALVGMATELEGKKNDPEYIPFMRMLRWMGSVNQQQFAATLATAQYLCDERFYKMPVKKFIDMTAGTCRCCTKDLKFTVLKRMVEFHGDGLAECIGMYLVRLQDEAPGRENGILFFGAATGTGKSTLALALVEIFPDSMVFVPVPDSKFPYDTYDAAKIKAQLLDEFRTDVDGFTPQLILRATGGDKRLKISQKGHPKMGNDKSCDSKTPVGADVPASQISNGNADVPASQISNGNASNLAANMPVEPEVPSQVTNTQVTATTRAPSTNASQVTTDSESQGQQGYTGYASGLTKITKVSRKGTCPPTTIENRGAGAMFLPGSVRPAPYGTASKVPVGPTTAANKTEVLNPDASLSTPNAASAAGGGVAAATEVKEKVVSADPGAVVGGLAAPVVPVFAAIPDSALKAAASHAFAAANPTPAPSQPDVPVAGATPADAETGATPNSQLQVPATPENLNEVHVNADTDTIEMLAGVFELLGLPLLPNLDQIPAEFVRTKCGKEDPRVMWWYKMHIGSTLYLKYAKKNEVIFPPGLDVIEDHLSDDKEPLFLLNESEMLTLRDRCQLNKEMKVYALVMFLDKQFIFTDCGVAGAWGKHMIYKHASLHLREGNLNNAVQGWANEAFARISQTSSRAAHIQAQCTMENLLIAADHYSMLDCPEPRRNRRGGEE